MKKTFNFASTLTNSTSYDGEQLESYILKAFTKSKFVESLPAQNIIQDIQFKKKVGRLDGSNLVQTGSTCTFNDSGTIVVSEKELYPLPYFINVQLCYEDLEAIYNSLNTGALNEEELSASFSAALTELMVSKMNANMQAVYINKLDSLITTHALTGDTPSASTIVSIFSQMVQAIPEDVLENENLTFYMNKKTLQLYYDYLATLAKLTPQDVMTPNYMGIKIVTIPTIATGKIYLLETGNIYIGVGALDDFSSLQIIDMKPLGQGNNVRLILQGKGDLVVGWEEEAVKYTGS